MSGVHRPAVRPGPGSLKLLDIQVPLSHKELRAESEAHEGECRLSSVVIIHSLAAVVVGSTERPSVGGSGCGLIVDDPLHALHGDS